MYRREGHEVSDVPRHITRHSDALQKLLDADGYLLVVFNDHDDGSTSASVRHSGVRDYYAEHKVLTEHLQKFGDFFVTPSDDEPT